MALAVPEQQPETFKGLPFDGIVVPDGLVTAKDIDHVRNGWDLFERTLPPGMRGFVDGSIQDPFDKRHLARRDAVAILANSMRDWTKKATQKVRDGKARPEDWKDWASVAFHQQMLTAAAVQGGGTHVLDSPTLQRRLAAVQANHELRMGSLQQRMLLGPDHPDGISLAQANAWGAQAQRGLIRTAGQMGAAESFGDRPVRRGMTAFEAHCLTCPSKAGLYTNIRECIKKCGGWVGDGSDQCHGNCLCYVRPASITSVYGDDMSGSLKVRLANLPPRPPTPAAPAQARPAAQTDFGGGGDDRPRFEPDDERYPLPAIDLLMPDALAVLTTVAQIEAWAKERWPGCEFDFTGAQPETVKPLLGELARLEEDWPATVASLRRVHVDKELSRLKIAFTKDGVISLNPAYFGDWEYLRFRKVRQAEEGFYHSESGSFAETMTHEFGHHLLAAVFDRGDPEIVGAVTDWLERHTAAGFTENVERDNGADEAWAEGFSMRYHRGLEVDDLAVVELHILLDRLASWGF